MRTNEGRKPMVEIARSFNVSHTTIARLGSEYLQAGWRKVSMGGQPDQRG